MYELSSAAYKVCQLVLKVVASGRMQNDQIMLHVSLATDDESPLRMSDKTFWRGMQELVAKQFLGAAQIPGMYWINPHLFFKGDRLLIVNEYVRQRARAKTEESVALPARPSPQ